MSIRCGHCWSYHPTVGDVRECWEILREHQPFCRLCSDPLADPIRRRRCAAGYKDGYAEYEKALVAGYPDSLGEPPEDYDWGFSQYAERSNDFIDVEGLTDLSRPSEPDQSFLEDYW